MKYLRLGVNIDHVATIRNARGGMHPDPVLAARAAVEAGADGITAHLREDRRHISDKDISRLKKEVNVPLNLEMAATEEMLAIALKTRPDYACIVPEKRSEVTTEGGIDVVKNKKHLAKFVNKLQAKNIKVSLFIDPEELQAKASADIGAGIVELHTGSYCNARGPAQKKELNRIKKAAEICDELGLECHAGHGLTFDNVGPIAAIANIVELNIGHFIIGEAIFIGLEESIRQMRARIDEAREI